MLKLLFTLPLNSKQPNFFFFTDEETEAERLHDLPKVTQLIIEGENLGQSLTIESRIHHVFSGGGKKKVMVKLNDILLSCCLPWKIALNSDLNVYSIQFKYIFDNGKI